MSQLALSLHDRCALPPWWPLPERCAVQTWWGSLRDSRCPMAGCWVWLWWMAEEPSSKSSEEK